MKTEMNNRIAFIDFVRGLLNINPLERWSPQQAKLHPFITQAKFTGPFVPPSNLKTPSGSNRSPAPGTQQQMQAEAVSKERARAAQAQAAQAYAATPTHAMPPMGNQYAPQQAMPQGQPVYNNVAAAMYSPATNAPPYPTNVYAQQPQMMPQQQAVMPQGQYAPSGNGPQVPQQSQNLYAQATTRAGRQRATTMEVQQGGIPAAIQRVASHLDPSQPIRLQPSPAYYPPPADGSEVSAGSARRRGSRAATGQQNMSGQRMGGQGQGQGNGMGMNFVRNLEERTEEGGFMGQQWH